MIMFVVGAANLFGWILTNAQVPHMLARSFATLTDSPIVFLMLVNVLLLFIGTLITASAAVVILTPILLPVATTGMGIDPMFFGVLMVVNLAIGCITPPVGLDLFVVASITGLSIDKVTAKVMPYLIMLLVDLVLLTYFPSIITFLPDLLR